VVGWECRGWVGGCVEGERGGGDGRVGVACAQRLETVVRGGGGRVR